MTAMSRGKAIMAYGTDEDRKKAAAMAALSGKSVSEWMLGLIRDQYVGVYGNTSPEKINVGRRNENIR